MSELDDLTTLVRAATPLLVIETVDEQRVIECFRHVIGQALRPLWRWTLTDGLGRLDFAQPGAEVAPDASATLEAIRAADERGIYLLFDFHPFLRYAMSLRQLREIVQRHRSAAHTIVLVGAMIELPPALEALAMRVPLALPGLKELAGILRGEAAAWQREQGRRLEVDGDAARTLVRNLVGLSGPDARRIVRKLIYNDGALGAADLPELMRAKFDLLNRSGLLHYEYATASFADVAGVSRLNAWIQRRRAVFLDPEPALDPPRGVLLLGVQGCGKSLAAKATAGGFGVPLVRLDFGTLYDKYQGETEKNLREALASVELLSPCVLWIDEIEKGLASGGGEDGGVSRRVLGYLLTWMAERKAKVFVVATANAVDQLPAELLRKGRFDEIFFVDLPTAEARAAIFELHLKRRTLDPASFDLPALAAASEGFSGAEIEQAIVSALYDTAGSGAPPDQDALCQAMAQTRPLSVLMREQVQALRAWARERCVPAD
ncbi:AAA family ATPase [Frateuria hangzhouensis]|uniref:AAA family ATPase n=1 Tax=Frateuria hangzhouensis TaxID=2995589 RepID=UPI002260B90B|nr:AAA family ATPase [Frateuria sp. STR12]MCX7513379.1 AAA family ATPase [Frateuria sp. STR12]